MEPRRLAELLSVGRVALGASMVAAPTLIGRLLLGRAGTSGGAQLLTRAFGARDLAIGAGLLAALRAGQPTRGWVGAGIVADVADFSAAALAGDDMPTFGRLAMLAAAATGTAGGIVLAQSLDSRG